jgi:hypothetical protein
MKLPLILVGVVLIGLGFVPQVVDALPAFSTWGLCFGGVGFLTYGLTAKDDDSEGGNVTQDQLW